MIYWLISALWLLALFALVKHVISSCDLQSDLGLLVRPVTVLESEFVNVEAVILVLEIKASILLP